jgi:hypothetical protein
MESQWNRAFTAKELAPLGYHPVRKADFPRVSYEQYCLDSEVALKVPAAAHSLSSVWN